MNHPTVKPFFSLPQQSTSLIKMFGAGLYIPTYSKLETLLRATATVVKQSLAIRLTSLPGNAS